MLIKLLIITCMLSVINCEDIEKTENDMEIFASKVSKKMVFLKATN